MTPSHCEHRRATHSVYESIDFFIFILESWKIPCLMSSVPSINQSKPFTFHFDYPFEIDGDLLSTLLLQDNCSALEYTQSFLDHKVLKCITKCPLEPSPL